MLCNIHGNIDLSSSEFDEKEPVLKQSWLFVHKLEMAIVKRRNIWIIIVSENQLIFSLRRRRRRDLVDSSGFLSSIMS